MHKLLNILGLVTFGTVVWSVPAQAIYWNVFNIEEETVQEVRFVTYNSLNDMLLDANRVATFAPNTFSSDAARNIVGSGATLFGGSGPGSHPGPEHSTMLLLGAGLTGLAASRWKRGKSV